MLLEAKVLIELWRVKYDTGRPYSALGWQPKVSPQMIPRVDRFFPMTSLPIAATAD